jgi:hypothetical protein
MLSQTSELVKDYAFDAFFFDMVYWPDVCVCESCRSRYQEEVCSDVPRHVDWYSPEWCRFQEARERWMTDVFRRLRDCVKARIDIPVFHNSSGMGYDWRAGFSHELASLSDVIGGDPPDFQDRSILPLFSALTPTVIQVMKPISGMAGGASQLRAVEEQKAHAFSAAALGGQYMAIDAVEPDGRVNPAAYRALAEVFDAIRPYEAYLGGKPIADVAVYWSLQGNVDLLDNGASLDSVFMSHGQRSHSGRSVEGVMRALSDIQVPGVVITRNDLGRLAEFSVVILPNVARMDHDELAAVREFVMNGGQIYASGHTSLVTTEGIRHPDFTLSDIFGCHFVGEETAAVTYIKPATREVADAIAPVHYVAHGEPYSRYEHARRTMRIVAEDSAEVLATTSLPYKGGRGTRDDRAWANLLASPPWDDTPHPAVIRHSYGRGGTVYVVADIESAWPSPAARKIGSSGTAARALFSYLIRTLLPSPLRVEVQTHPDVSISIFHDEGVNRIRLCFQNRPARFPALPIPRTSFRVAAPVDARFTSLRRAATDEPVSYSVADDGSLRAELRDLGLFEMLIAGYERTDGR